MSKEATKVCTNCRAGRPVSEFQKNWSEPDGLQRHCKACRKIERKEAMNEPGRRESRLAKIKAYQRTLRGKFKRAKNVAINSRKLEFLLTFDEYLELVKSGKCHYCGGGLPEAGHGLDRVDSGIGYAKANCVPCCRECNVAKMSMPHDDYIRLCNRVAALHPLACWRCCLPTAGLAL